ncbi:MAG: cytidylate kinase-like family protein [Candidatus Zixiibacteriota bacterium]|nr:MAG: cytidylate kinase-like family protein [candidate division Zixibacteria bacterium]
MVSIETIIERQLKRWELQQQMLKEKPKEKPRLRPIITVSRGYGAHGEEVAGKLSELTGFQLLDREILDAIINDIGIQNKMVELFDEDTRSELESWFYGMITGRIVDKSDYLKSLAKIIGSILKYGETIIVGRGANVIVGLDRGFHLRVTASMRKRADTIAERLGISYEEAFKQIEESDKRKAAYFKKSFGVDINDVSLYDMIVSTDNLTVDDAVELALLAYGKKEKALWGKG